MEDKIKSENWFVGLISKFINQNYENEIPGAIEMANEYLKGTGDRNDMANRIIKSAMLKTSTAGFISGLGGLITLPVAIPGDIIVTTKVQIKMIMAIAILGGKDIETDEVKNFVRACLLGDIAKDTLTDVGIKAGNRAALKLVSRLGSKTPAIFGKIASKSIPVLGGLIGGTVNATATQVIGTMAKRRFIEVHTDPGN